MKEGKGEMKREIKWERKKGEGERASEHQPVSENKSEYVRGLEECRKRG